MEIRGEMSRLFRQGVDTEGVETTLPDNIMQRVEETSPTELSANCDEPKVEPASEVAEDGLAPVLDRAPEDLLEFASWVFGNEGIPSLQVLAYGDFSFGGRFENHSFIFCRGEWELEGEPKENGEGGDIRFRTLPFRLLRDGDAEMKELVSENRDFLTTCPTDTILLS